MYASQSLCLHSHVGSADSISIGHKHLHAKRAVVTNYVVVEIPEVVVWVDGAGNTVSVETKGPIITYTQDTRPTCTAPVDTPAPIVSDEGFVGVEIENKGPVSTQAVTATPQETTSQKTTSHETVTVSSSADPVTTTLTLSSVAPPPSSPPVDAVVPAPPASPSAVIPDDQDKNGVDAVPAPPPSPSAVIPDDQDNNGVDAVPAPPASPSTVISDDQDKSGTGDGIGICYAPYNSDGSCKTQEQVNDDFSRLPQYTLIRSYGVDCRQITHMVNAAKLHKKKLFVGIFDLLNLQGDLDILIKSVGSSWDLITTVSVGNELINSGTNSVQDVVNAVNTVRAALRGAGYSGPVVIVDTFNAIIANPELCHASDFCAANCHAFFDPNSHASEAGAFVKKQAELVSSAAGGKKTVITESGWPHQGAVNGEAAPSDQDQETALASLRAAFKGTDGELYLFSAFDDAWKVDNAMTFGTERYWGIA